MSSKVDQNENRRLQDLEVDREGINSLAAWQSLDPDKESLIYRKFGYLSARRSLHLQNKLLDLEDQLEDLDAKVRQGDTNAKKSLRKHEIFEQRSTRKDSIDEQRMILLDKIDAGLDNYYKSLLTQAEIANLRAPRPRVVKAYRSYFNGTGPADKLVYGKAQGMLDYEQDLVALHTPTDIDFLSTLLQDQWPRTFAKRRAHPGETTLFFQGAKVQRVVATVNVLVASILIIGAVVGLYKLRNQPDPIRLGSIAAFTALFSISLGLLTNAKRAEIFAATAAYTAVLVVFISGDLGNSGSGSGSVNSRQTQTH